MSFLFFFSYCISFYGLEDYLCFNPTKSGDGVSWHMALVAVNMPPSDLVDEGMRI